MNKYLLLLLINTPLLAIGILEALSGYKTNRISRRRCIVQVLFWLSVAVVLVLMEPIYNTLIRFNLTNSTPLSIFDIVLLTLLLFCLFLIKKSNESITRLNRKISRLHESLVISEAQRNWDKEK
jgi:hypothetical protein